MPITAATRGTMLPPEVTSNIFNLTKGRSALATLKGSEPIPFNGTTDWTFSLDQDVDIVAEGGAKSHGGLTLAPVKTVPIKFEYGARVTDEFLYGTEEYQLRILQNFADGASKKFARGLDIAAMLNLNPRSKETSAVIGTNSFLGKVTNVIGYTGATPDSNIDDAIGVLNAAEYEANGLVISAGTRTAMAGMTLTGGQAKYPQFAFGAIPERLGTMRMDATVNMQAGNTGLTGIVGDFDYFKWGYAKEIPLEVIQYGDPDGQGDLKRYNMVYLRIEAYIGWAILVPAAFCLIRDTLPLTVASAAGTASGDTAITVTETKGTGNIYKYKVDTAAASVVYGQDLSAWTTWDGESDITAATGRILTLAECTSAGKALKVGTVTVTAHA